MAGYGIDNLQTIMQQWERQFTAEEMEKIEKVLKFYGGIWPVYLKKLGNPHSSVIMGYIYEVNGYGCNIMLNGFGLYVFDKGIVNFTDTCVSLEFVEKLIRAKIFVYDQDVSKLSEKYFNEVFKEE